jgi:hypothetical protein
LRTEGAAASIQRAVLPLALSEIAGLRLAARYLPAPRGLAAVLRPERAGPVNPALA